MENSSNTSAQELQTQQIEQLLNEMYQADFVGEDYQDTDQNDKFHGTAEEITQEDQCSSSDIDISTLYNVDAPIRDFLIKETSTENTDSNCVQHSSNVNHSEFYFLRYCS